MQRGKRALEYEHLVHNPKKQKLTEEVPIDSVSDAPDDWKLLNGYILFLNQCYRGEDVTSKTVSPTFLEPLVKLIKNIKFDQMSNVWFQSRIILDLVVQEYLLSDIRIYKATTYVPPQIGVTAYESNSLRYFCTPTDEQVNSTEIASDLIVQLDSDSTTESDSDSDYVGFIKHIVKVVHLEKCSINQIIGNTSKEIELYNSILGLQHKQKDEGELYNGWIINPQWINGCSLGCSAQCEPHT